LTPRKDSQELSLQASDPIPQRLQILGGERQFSNILIKIAVMAKALFRLFHASRDAGIAGEAERNQGNFGMYRLRPEQNGFGLLNAFGAPKRIGETDPPAWGLRINLYQMTGNCRDHVPLLGRHV